MKRILSVGCGVGMFWYAKNKRVQNFFFGSKKEIEIEEDLYCWGNGYY